MLIKGYLWADFIYRFLVRKMGRCGMAMHYTLFRVTNYSVFKKMRHLSSLVSPSVIMLQLFALYVQREEILSLVFDTEKHFRTQILKL